jgi:hypothetical protein
MSTPFFSDLIPPTTERVPRHTTESVNERIIRHTDMNVGSYAADRRLIDMRLQDLDREWDIERTLEANAEGWCPPVNLFRRLGVRTQREIDEERYALKLMRGDFAGVSHATKTPVKDVMHAIRR